jgi:hypothetical protein
MRDPSEMPVRENPRRRLLANGKSQTKVARGPAAGAQDAGGSHVFINSTRRFPPLQPLCVCMRARVCCSRGAWRESGRPSRPFARDGKVAQRVKARTSSPRPQFRVTSLSSRCRLAENVSIRKLAPGRTDRRCSTVYTCVHGAAIYCWRDGGSACRDSVRKSSANEEISKLRPGELSLTTPGSIIAGLNAVITSRARASERSAVSRVLDEQRKV